MIGVIGAVWRLWYQRLPQRQFSLHNGRAARRARPLPAVRDIKDPAALGVHRAAAHPAVTATQPGGRRAEPGWPAYVPRDGDHELREGLAAGEFVLLVGDSLAGKSRMAFEAMSVSLAGHALVCPADRSAVAAAVARAGQQRRCVLWLDDLEAYLGPGGLTAAHIGQLLGGASEHRVIMATIRAAELARIAACHEAGQISPDVREVLELAHPIRVARVFTGAELDRARARGWDPRIADAVGRADSRGVPECLACGPELLREWEDARASSQSPAARGAALVAAAVDIRRAGYASPVPRALIDQVHEHYLDDPQRSGRPRKALGDAWDWATGPRPAGGALLRPSGHVVRVPGYLIDSVERRAGRAGQVPEPVVRAAIDQAGAADLDSIAAAAHLQARYALAEHAWRRACRAKASDGLLGPEHPGTLASRSGLACALHLLGRLEDAEAEHRVVLDGRTAVLGADDPDTLASRSYLAGVLRDQGRLAEAEAEHRAVLEARIRVLGADDPGTLASRSYLAGVLREQGRLAEAEAEARAVLDGRTRVLGPDHRDTLASRSDLAVILRAHGRLAEAEAEHRAELEARSRTLGSDHPETLSSRGDLASALRAQGRLEEAEAEYAAIAETIAGMLGADHPAALTARSNLALVLRARGRLVEAEAEHRAILDGRIGVLGAEHPETLASRGNLASVLAARGRLEEAETEHRAIAETMCRVLGADHPSALGSRGNLALVLSALGRLEEAEADHRAIAQTLTRVLGADHPDTLTGRSNLASVLCDLGRLEEAQAENRAVLDGRTRVLGAGHPDTLASRSHLAGVLRALGRHEDAEHAALPPEPVS
jgi:tetratricopeptide (TPR) repeat protein